jgi:hypothetical protein
MPHWREGGMTDLRRNSIVESNKSQEAWILPDSFRDWVGGDLLCHAVTRAVPSALRSLTTVFGMGTGVASSLKPPAQKQGSESGTRRSVILARLPILFRRDGLDLGTPTAFDSSTASYRRNVRKSGY